MNPRLSKSSRLLPPKKRLSTLLGLMLLGAGWMWAAHVVFAATPAPVAKTNVAKSQSSDDVLKWLQMTGTKSAGDVKEEKDQKAVKETPSKTTSSASSASNVANASTSNHSRPIATEKTIPHPVLEVPTSASAALEPVVTVASAPTSALTLPPEAQIPVATAVTPALSVEPEVKVLSRAQPDFPREAENRGVTKGKVVARLYVGTDGVVTRVEIVEASPKRVFDSAVTTAAMRWKFSPMSVPNATEVTFNFKMVE